MREVRDCEYGDYKYIANEEPTDLEDFTPSKEAQDYIKEHYRDMLEDCAYVCGLNTEEWDSYDWRQFEDIIYDYR